MGKRVLTLFLAVLLIFNVGAEPVLAMGAQGQNENSEAKDTGDAGNENIGNESTKEEESGSEIGNYTITFDFAGGKTQDGSTKVSQQAVGGTYDTSLIPAPLKTGYRLDAWLDAAGNAYQFNRPITANITLTASWVPITYRVQFNKNGGTGSMPEMSLKYDAQAVLPANRFTRKGYTFVGWQLPGGKIAQPGSDIKNLSSQNGAVVVLKAVWEKGSYTIRFNSNGGTGKMDDQVLSYGKKKALYKNKFTRNGYSFANWNTKKDGKGTSYKNKEKVKSLTDQSGGIVVLFAMWKGNPYQVKYDGNGADKGTMANSKHIYGTSGKLKANKFKKKGYSFAGWNTRKDGEGKNYSNKASVKNLTTKENGTVTLYAKWKVVKYKITYKTKGGKMPKSVKKTYNVTTESFVLPRPTRKGYDFDGWYKDAKYKERIGKIRQGRTGNLTLYAKWVKCTRKGNKSSAKITKCKAVGPDKVKIKASIKNRIASSDDYYYLVYVNPISREVYKMSTKTYKKKNIVFNLKPSENQGYVTSMFGIAVKRNGKYHLISDTSYVKSPQNAAKNQGKYRPGKTKKGMQFDNNMQEIKDCGAKQNFLNVTVSYVFGNGTVPYKFNGKTYYFNDMSQYRQIVEECNKKDITVTMQVLLDWTEHSDLIAAKARVPGGGLYYSWNINSNKAREKMEAMFSYLGYVFGQKNCCVMNWVLGNEVNTPNGWNYQGGMSETAYFRAYAYAFRSLYYAIKSQYANANIFICTDNRWNTSVRKGYSAKHVISSFTNQLNQIQKGLKWNLAYHAYSCPITYTRFWKGYGTTNDENSPYITMKNINVLTNYIKRNYGSSVRIILSEQGYSSVDGEAEQAAALAYSYYIAACNPMIDSFIIRSYTDHPVEVAQGLRMGIAGKEAFNVYKNMDTSKSEQYTNGYLGLIGASSWRQIVPGYSKSRIKKMYRRL